MRIMHFYYQNCKKSEDTSIIFTKLRYFIYFKIQKLNSRTFLSYFFYLFTISIERNVFVRVILRILHLEKNEMYLQNIYINMHCYIITVYYTIAMYFDLRKNNSLSCL